MTQEEHPFARGPYLTSALLCELVLQESNGVNSIIRVIDRLTVSATGLEPPPEMPTSQHKYTLYVAFKSGSARGVKELKLRLQKPSGDSPPATTYPLNFEGEDDRGVNLVIQMAIDIDEVGLWWFDVSLDGVSVTKIPLRVIYLRQPTPGPQAEAQE